jgi:signal transduction histidine kinase
MFKYPALFLLFLWLAAAVGCRNGEDANGHRFVEAIDEPLNLPYKFVTKEMTTSYTRDTWIPVRVTADGQIGLCIIGANWLPPDTVTAVVFCEEVLRRKAIRHVNLPTLKINSFYPFDFDNDGLDEVALSYVRRDSVWLEILHVNDRFAYKQFLAAGIDRDGNGYWDGYGFFCGTYDFNGDGFVELLVGVDTGYDLYPRRLYCIDWRNQKTLWEYSYAGIVGMARFFAGPLAPEEDVSVVLGLASKGNAAVERDMDDQHSYLIVLDENGNEKWKKVTGGVFTSAMPVIVDYDSDGSFEIAVPSLTRIESPDSDIVEIDIYDRTGRRLDSVLLDSGQRVNGIGLFDLNGDGSDEILASLTDNSILVFQQDFQPVKKSRLYTVGFVWDCRDFLGLGRNQILISPADRKLLLLSDDFRPLAQFAEKVTFRFQDYLAARGIHRMMGNRIVLNEAAGRSNYVLALESTPWYTIFSRNPILAFLAGFIPLSLIIGVIWYVMAAFRQKSKIISRQRDELEKALVELKETQEKLIAAEKYKQARDIAGGVAHEIHNALSPALNSVEKLQQLLNEGRPVDQERIDRLLSLIDRSLARANNMTELVGKFSRLEAEKAGERVNLKLLIEEIIDDHKSRLDSMNVILKLDLPADVSILCHKPHAYSLFNNLMLNSLDALSESDNRAINLTAEISKGLVRVVFGDSGPGIPSENLPRIFDAFYSTRPSSGTGLGLAIVKKIVDLYDGQIRVESVLDKGAKFTILLPSG